MAQTTPWVAASSLDKPSDDDPNRAMLRKQPKHTSTTEGFNCWKLWSYLMLGNGNWKMGMWVGVVVCVTGESFVSMWCDTRVRC
jgi:hypothetical protein